MPFPATEQELEHELAERLNELGGSRWSDAAERRRVAQQVREEYWGTYRPDVRGPRASLWIAGPQGTAPLPPGRKIYVVTLSYVGEMHKHGSEPPMPRKDEGVYSDPMKAKADDVARALNELEEDP